MVHLFNIQKEGNSISCDYTPETSNESGHVVIDTTSFEVSDVQFSKYEFGKKMYVSHVRSKLEELFASGNSLPKEATAIWY